MIARTHRSFSFASATGTLLAVNQLTTMFDATEPKMALAQGAVITFVAVATATLPDLDQVIPFIRHRGITHSIWAIMLIAFLTWKFQADILYFTPLFGLLIGYTSHIIGDAFSNAGIAWFYPLQGYEGSSGGAFYVRGFRGIFQPLYRVGAKTFIAPTIIWNTLALVFAFGFITNFI